jgi:hypothetical protein
MGSKLSICFGHPGELVFRAMQVQDLARAYQAKTDEELLELAGDPEQLTPEAHAALKTELAKRRIERAGYSNAQQGNDKSRLSAKHQRDAASPGDVMVSDFVAEVLQVYHGNFWLFVRLIAPAVVVGYIAVVMGRNEAREIAHHLPRGLRIIEHKTEILEMGFANLGAFLVSWTAFSFSFGAICSAVGQIESGILPSASGCFAKVRQRIGSFLRLSLVLFLGALVAVAAAGLLSTVGLWVLDQRQTRLSLFTIQVVSFGSVALTLLVLSRFGLAMPAFILDNCRVGQAMFRSDELTEGKWVTLAILLAKSLIGGYVAGMFPFWLARWMWNFVRLPWWSLSVASIGGVTLVEPFMFIGFALLYTRVSAPPSTSTKAAAQLA